MADEKKRADREKPEETVPSDVAAPRPDPVGERNYALSEPAVLPEGVGTPGAMRNAAPVPPPTPPTTPPVRPPSTPPVHPPVTPPARTQVVRTTDHPLSTHKDDDKSDKKTTPIVPPKK